MSVTSKRIGKVIISGQWFTVELDSFQVVDMEFTDDDGNPIHNEALGVKAYHFRTQNKDEYYGPLSSIELFKLIDI
jgi:hypothetical protein